MEDIENGNAWFKNVSAYYLIRRYMDEKQLMREMYEHPHEPLGEAAGMEFVGILAGRGDHVMLSLIAQDEKLSVNVKEAANKVINSVVKKEVDYLIERKNYVGLIELGDCEWVPSLLKEYIKGKIKHVVREIIDLNVRLENANFLYNISRDKRLPLELREAAGIAAVEIYDSGEMYRNRYTDLIDVAEDNELPDKVRQAARDKIESKIMKIIDSCYADGQWLLDDFELIDVAADKRLSEYEHVRKATMKKVRDRIMKRIEETQPGASLSLLRMFADDERLPEDLRKAVRDAIQKNDVKTLEPRKPERMNPNAKPSNGLIETRIEPPKHMRCCSRLWNRVREFGRKVGDNSKRFIKQLKPRKTV